jgi:hypothetical protein
LTADLQKPRLRSAPESGDAWLLDKEDGLAAQLAPDGDPEPMHIEETDANSSIE